jgi:hypothetical protein
MLKIVTHQALQRAVLVTLFHPLSLDCRMEILRGIESSKTISAVSSAADLGKSPSVASTDAADATGGNTIPNVPLVGNSIKEAWDRLYQASNQKIAMLMMYIEHILLDRIVPTAIDSTPGNEILVPHEVDEEYLTAHCPAITPLRTLNDPKNDAITMLQSLSYLPPKEVCDAQCLSAAVAQAQMSTTPGAVSPLVKKESSQSGSTLSENGDPSRGAGNDLWSSELTGEDAAVYEDSASHGANITADCDAEANVGIASRNKVSFTHSETAAAGGEAPKEYGRLERNGEDDFTSPVVKKDRFRLGRNDMLMPTESTMGVGLNSADQLVLPALRKLDEVMTEKLPFYPEVKVAYSVEPVFALLCKAQNYSITTVQVAAHLVYSLSLLVASARNLAMPSAPSSKGNSFSGNPKGSSFSGNPKGSSFSGNKGNSFSSNPPEREQRIFFPDGCDPSGLMNQSVLEYFAVRIREAGRFAAMKLLVRLEGQTHLLHLLV